MVSPAVLASLAALAAPDPALAAPTGGGPASADAPPEIVVTADRAGLVERGASALVLGLPVPLLETPRAATAVGALTLERYGVTEIDQLVAIAPSAYTASFYGVPGSLNVRGTLAEDYFEGFKEVENRGTFALPVKDAAELDVVRGPPSPALGPGKVGGLLNFTPQSARDGQGFPAAPGGAAELTLGAYQEKEATLSARAPVAAFAARGGLAAFLDVEDDHSFYRGVRPRRQTLETSLDLDLARGWRLRLDLLAYHSDGDVQTAGWNRLTQGLIDTGAYQAGRNAALVDLNADGRIEANEPGAFPYGGLYGELVCYAPGCTNAVHQLTLGVQPARLSTRTVDVSDADFSRTLLGVAYLRLERDLPGGADLRLELFNNDLANDRFVSYGFPAAYRTQIGEGRATLDERASAFGGLVSVKGAAGLSYRYVEAHLKESFNSGIIALDRRDLSVGATATDVIASPFDLVNGQPGWPWELDVRSAIRDAGAFADVDVAVARRLHLVLGGREDDFNASSADTGVLSYETNGVDHAHGSRAKGSWTAGVILDGPFGLRPYYTFDRSDALELDQASDLLPGVIGADGRGGWISASFLSEAGVKIDAADHRLQGGLSVYRQTRTDLIPGPGGASLQGTRSKGVELELRWVVNRRLSFTYAGDVQRTEVKGPDGTFVYLPPSVFGVPGVLGYGGSYAGTISSLPGRAGDYEDSLIPHSVSSLYATLTSDPLGFGRLGSTLGATWVSRTATIVQNGVTYPAYWLANASAYLESGPYRVTLSADNLFNARYFTPNADPTYENVAALPGIGRTWRLIARRAF